MATERDLLFGLLALQNGLVDQGGLVAAFQAWTREKARPLADHLVDRRDLDADQRSAIEAMVTLHLKKHGGDAGRSLAAIPAGRSTREALGSLADPDLDASIALAGPDPYATRLPAGPGSAEGNVEGTASYSVGTDTSMGQRFRILRPHARGGLGAVFVALDGELNREVALKEIQDHHADDPASRSRFLLEAEITGGLEHPGIVPVYGLGTYSGGRPFYAMRFIRGDSLKEAIEGFHLAVDRKPGARDLELRRLLRRFLDVCNAIDYAHSRGVLHRDIKPGNVMVGRYGETLVVDWGLAKAVGMADRAAESGERTLRPTSSSGSADTLPGSAIGTPAFMSPEQAAGDLDTLGPRSDVYSLGATLYALLTGKAPFEGDAMGVLLKVERGEFPPPRRLDPSIDLALEAVCLKAMATKPGDRYASCRALAEDIERWTADEPVSAYREPIARRARRWARRNRTAVTSATVAMVAVVIGLSAVAAEQSRSNAALKKANGETSLALIETQKAQKATVAALGQSEGSREQAEAVGKFLVEALKKPDPSIDGKDVKVADVLDQALAGLDKGFPGSKATKGALLDSLGRSYYGLGLHAKAGEAYRKALAIREVALGPDHPDTLTTRNNLATTYRSAGRTAEAIAMHQATLKLRLSKLGPDHPDTLQSSNNLAAAYWSAGRNAEAIVLHEATFKLFESKLGPDHPMTLSSRSNLAAAYSSAGRNAEAIAMGEATLKLRQSKLGPDNPDTLTSRNVLAFAYLAAGRTAEAIAMHEATLKLRQSKLGPDHPDTLTSRSNLAAAYSSAGRLAEATAMHEATLKLRQSKLGPDHPDTLTSRNNLAATYSSAGRTAEATAMHEATLKLRLSKLGPDHPDTLQSRNNLAFVYSSAGRIAEAIAMGEATLRLSESRLGPDHPATLTTRSNLAAAYSSAGRTAEAIALHEATLRLSESKLGLDHPDTLRNRNNLLRAYESSKRWVDAEHLYRTNLELRRKNEKPDSPLLAGDLANLGRNLLQQSKWSEAEPLLAQCLAIRVKAIPDDYRRFNTESLLGGTLLGEGKYAEAEPLIVGGYEGMKAREAKIAVSGKNLLTEAAERVVHLYHAWGKPEQADAWAARLGLAQLPANVFAPE